MDIEIKVQQELEEDEDTFVSEWIPLTGDWVEDEAALMRELADPDEAYEIIDYKGFPAGCAADEDFETLVEWANFINEVKKDKVAQESLDLSSDEAEAIARAYIDAFFGEKLSAFEVYLRYAQPYEAPYDKEKFVLGYGANSLEKYLFHRELLSF